MLPEALSAREKAQTTQIYFTDKLEPMPRTYSPAPTPLARARRRQLPRGRLADLLLLFLSLVLLLVVEGRLVLAALVDDRTERVGKDGRQRGSLRADKRVEGGRGTRRGKESDVSGRRFLQAGGCAFGRERERGRTGRYPNGDRVAPAAMSSRTAGSMGPRSFLAAGGWSSPVWATCATLARKSMPSSPPCDTM